MQRDKAGMAVTNHDRAGASRRGFIRGTVLLAGSMVALAAAPAGAASLRVPPVRTRRPVVAFHADQLYLDTSGTAEPYLPPDGLRTLDHVEEEALRHLVYCF